MNGEINSKLGDMFRAAWDKNFYTGRECLFPYRSEENHYRKIGHQKWNKALESMGLEKIYCENPLTNKFYICRCPADPMYYIVGTWELVEKILVLGLPI
jgi:hypothetical protein